jgi:hypothetical protein
VLRLVKGDHPVFREVERHGQITALRMRIERTESRLRMLVLALVLSVSALSVTALTQPGVSQQVPQYLAVKQLDVVDDTGRRRISLRTEGREAYVDIFNEAREIGFEAHVGFGAVKTVEIGRGPSGPLPLIGMIASPQISLVSIRTNAEPTNVTLGVGSTGPGLTINDQGRSVFKVP